MRFSPGCSCCSTMACCRCEAQPVYWSFTWPSLADLLAFDEEPPAGGHVLRLANCSTSVNPEGFASHTRWESEGGFSHTSGAVFQPWFVLTCGRPTEAEGGPDRQYRLLVYARNSFDSAQVVAAYVLVIADVPSAEECLGPIDLPLTSDPFGLGAPDPLTLTAVL